MIATGLVCVAGMCGLLLDAGLDWTDRIDRLPTEMSPGPGAISFQDMFVSCGLLDWLGAWAYLAACAWLPTAVWRIARAHRDGWTLRRLEAVVVSAVAVLAIVVPWMLWAGGTLFR